MIRLLTCGTAAIAGLAAAPPALASPVALGLKGTANHRRPLPGEAQIVRWTVRNLGTRPITRAWLDTAIPQGWRLRQADGCQVSGRRVHCTFGPVEADRRTVVLTMVAGPRLGPVRLRAVTGFVVDGQAYAGPATGMRLLVVRHR